MIGQDLEATTARRAPGLSYPAAYNTLGRQPTAAPITCTISQGAYARRQRIRLSCLYPVLKGPWNRRLPLDRASVAEGQGCVTTLLTGLLGSLSCKVELFHILQWCMIVVAQGN